jgi:hypothetical protein
MTTKSTPKSDPKDPKTRSYLEPHSFDRRVRDRNLTSGAIDQKGLDKYLGELSDVADRAEPVVTQPPGMPGGSAAS